QQISPNELESDWPADDNWISSVGAVTIKSCLEEPLISHGWRRRQTHLRALFNLPCYLPCLFEVSMSSAGSVNVQNRTPEIPAVQRTAFVSLVSSRHGRGPCAVRRTGTFAGPADDMETSNKQGRRKGTGRTSIKATVD
ncbi:hypothetical protein D4764_04G0015940, partial [Takifugu flavidus]